MLIGFFARSNEIDSSFDLRLLFSLANDACDETGAIIAVLLLATPVTLTLLCDVRLGLLLHENFAVILFCPGLIAAYEAVSI